MTCSTDLRDRHVAGCGQPDPEPTLWMTTGPLIRENNTAETTLLWIVKPWVGGSRGCGRGLGRCSA